MSPVSSRHIETAEVHARIPGYVKGWTVNIGDSVKKRQVLAELSDPELEADLRQKEAAIEQAIAKRKQAEAAVEVARADIAGSEAKLAVVRAGVNRADADAARWRAEHRRVGQLFEARAQTGTLLDETRSKLGAADAAVEEVKAQVKSAEVGLVQARAALDRPRRTSPPRPPPSMSPGPTPTTPGDARLHPDRGPLRRRRRPAERQHRRHDPARRRGPAAVRRRPVGHRHVAVNVPEAVATEVNPGDRATVKLQAMNGRVVDGKVSRISWARPQDADDPRRDRRTQPRRPAPPGPLCVRHDRRRGAPRRAHRPGGGDRRGERKAALRGGGRRQGRAPPGRPGPERRHAGRGRLGPAPADAVVKANAASLADGQLVQVIEPARP